MGLKSGYFTVWTTGLSFILTYALEAKSVRNNADVLNIHIIPYFGVPCIINLDNGRVFVNGVLSDLLKFWHSNINSVS